MQLCAPADPQETEPVYPCQPAHPSGPNRTELVDPIRTDPYPNFNQYIVTTKVGFLNFFFPQFVGWGFVLLNFEFCVESDGQLLLIDMYFDLIIENVVVGEGVDEVFYGVMVLTKNRMVQFKVF